MFFYIRSLALPILVSFSTQPIGHGTAPQRTCIYTLSPGPSQHQSIVKHMQWKAPLFPLLARVPSPQVSRYARYGYPRAFSASWECSHSFSPLRLSSEMKWKYATGAHINLLRFA